MNTLFQAKSRADEYRLAAIATKPPFSPPRGGAKERYLNGCGVNRDKFLQQTHESESPKSQSSQKKQSHKLFLFPIIAIISRQR